MSKVDINIARPQEEDAEQIRNLFAETVSNNFMEEGIWETMKEDAGREIMKLTNTLEKDFESNGELEYFLIAKSQDKIVGTIAHGQPSKIITENLNIDFFNMPEVKCVYVLPSFQNTGIGSILLQKILTHLVDKGVDEFCLDSGYKKAQQFWGRKLGNPICTLSNYWTTGSHHMIWLCKIDSLKTHGIINPD